MSRYINADLLIEAMQGRKMDSEVYDSCWNCGNHEGAWNYNPCELSEEEDKNKEPKYCPHWVPKNW